MAKLAVLATLLLLLVESATISVDCSVGTYYAGVNLSEHGAVLAAALQARTSSPHTVIPYTATRTDTWDALELLDADPTDASKVIPIYTQNPVKASLAGDTNGWNREHLWPKSYGVGYSGPDFSDLHMLRASDWNVNSARSNLYFDECEGCNTPAHAEAAQDTAKNSKAFRPPSSVKGDIARALFYMAIRYDGTEANTEDLQLTRCPCTVRFAMGNLDALLAWHEEDPVDNIEMVRNSAVCSDFQGNRNPFIDHPTLASKLWTVGAADSICDSGCSVDPSPTSPPDSSVGSGKPGACAIVGFQADNADDLALLLLVDFEAGTKLHITDNGVRADGSLRRNEGIRSTVLTAPQAAAGTVLRLSDFFTHEEGSFALSSSGDQVIVFTGSVNSPTYLCALNVEGQEQWQADATSASTSRLPPGLENGVNAVAILEADSAVYQGTTRGTPAELRSAINDVDNWAVSDSNRLAMPMSFQVLGTEMTSTNPPPTVTNDSSITSRSSVTRCVTISASLAASINAVR